MIAISFRLFGGSFVAFVSPIQHVFHFPGILRSNGLEPFVRSAIKAARDAGFEKKKKTCVYTRRISDI